MRDRLKHSSARKTSKEDSTKFPTSFRLSPLALDMLADLAAMHGLSATSYIEMVIRRDAKALSISPKAK